MPSLADIENIVPQMGKIGKTSNVHSTANWQYNQPGYTYNQVGLEYGGLSNTPDMGPQLSALIDL